MLLRCYTALVFVPDNRIIEYFNVLSISIPADVADEISPFVEYFAETYIGRVVYQVVNGDDEDGDDGERLVLRIRRQPRWQNPKFPPRLWSVYERVLDDEPMTTNVLEGWHRRFRSIVAKHHPNIYDFIGCLRSENSRTETQVKQLYN